MFFVGLGLKREDIFFGGYKHLFHIFFLGKMIIYKGDLPKNVNFC